MLSHDQETEIELMRRDFWQVPEIRAKQLWQHEVIKWLHRTQSPSKFDAILTAYADNRWEGIRAFERASRLMKEEKRHEDRNNLRRTLFGSWQRMGNNQ